MKLLKIFLILANSILFSVEAFSSHAAGMDITYKFIGVPGGISGSQITINVGGGNTNWHSEISWDILDPSSGTIIASGGAPFSGTICIPNVNLGDLEFRTYDSWGDGWNGSTYSISGNSTLSGVISGTLNTGYGPGINTFNIIGGSACTTTEILQYEITLNFYYDCENANPPPPNDFELRWYNWSTSSNFLYNTINLSQIGNSTSVTPVCNSITDPCSYGLDYAYEKYTYTGIITFPNRGSWKIWNQPLNARNNTTYGPTINSDALCVIANINNTTYLSSSPVFSSDPVSFLCSGGDCFYNGATDPDLDDLSYSLTQPKVNQGASDNMNYQNGTYLQPFPSGTSTCDPLTGDLCINTTSTGTSVAAIKVNESRNGFNTGFVTRDIQVWARNCNGAANSIITTLSNAGTIIDNTNNSFSFCVDGSSQLNFSLQAASSVNIEMLSSLLPNGATFSVNPSNPLSSTNVTGTFNWIPTAADITGSPYTFNININDDECPIPNSQSETYLIYLNDFSISDNSTPLTSCLNPDGTCTIIPNTSSNLGYTYEWNTIPIQTSATAIGLNAGSYICIVTDTATGCITNSSPIIVTSSIILPNVTATATSNTICENDPTTLSGGGTAGVTYIWDNGITNGISFNPNLTTTYTVTGIDSNGCTSSDLTTITVIPNTTSSDVLTVCDSYTWLDGVNYMNSNNSATWITTNTATGCDNIATLDLTINNSTSNTTNQITCDSYTWVANNQTFTVSGTYIDLSTNASGCSHTETLNLTINNFTTNTSNLIECDTYTWAINGITYTADGTYIDVSVDSVTGCPHTETLNLSINNSTSNTITLIECDSYTWAVNGITYTASGTYTDVSSNISGCPHTETLNLTILNSTENTTNQTSCDTYTWAVNNQTYTITGSYTEISTNTVGCTHTETLNLVVGYTDEIDVIIAENNISCFGYNDGSINLIPNGGTPPFQYSWDNGSVNQNINALSPGNYSFTLTDSNGCKLDSIVTINEANQIFLDFIATSPICRYDESTLSINISNSSSNVYTMLLQDSILKSFVIDTNGLLIPEGIPITLSPNFSEEVYIVSLTDTEGCTGTYNDDVYIEVKQLPQLELNEEDICIGNQSFTLNNATPNGGFYSINDELTNYFDVENLGPGEYNIGYNYTDPISSCSNQINEIITILESPKAEMLFSPQPTDIDNPNIYFRDNSNETVLYSEWNLGDGTIVNDETNFWHTYQDTGTHNIKYHITNNFGCTDSITGKIIINPIYSAFIPNSFTPNNDGDNDYFYPLIIGGYIYTMKIYNRWGEIIYNEDNGQWDGKVNNNLVPNEIYSYSILINDFKDKPFIYTGIVTLIK